MKGFISKIAQIILLVISIQVFLIAGVVSFQRTFYSFKVPQDRHTLILGHSLTEFAINDSIYADSFNYSYSGTGFNYSYAKLRKILNQNDHIDTILFGIKPSDFTVAMSHEFKPSRISDQILKHFYLLSLEEIKDYIYYPIFYTALCNIPLDFVLTYPRILKSHYSMKSYDIGWYRYTDECHLDIPKDSIPNYDLSIDAEYNPFALKYFNKIVSLCKERNVKLVFVTPPMYLSKGNIHFQSVMKQKGLTYYDFSNFPLSPTEFFDSTHINARGARKFSSVLDALINHH